MPDLAGKLDIDLGREDANLAVSIRSSRPVTAAGVFAGKSVPDVARVLPTLFSICSTAQAQACVDACEQALGLTASAATHQQRAFLLHAERVKEHLWRLLLDWPQALGTTPRHVPMGQALRAFLALRAGQGTDDDPFAPGVDLAPIAADSRRAGPRHSQAAALVEVAAGQLFGMPPGTWLEQVSTQDAFADWAKTCDTVASALIARLLQSGLAGLGRNGIAPLPVTLPDSALKEISAALAGADADAFIAAPTWRGQVRETTPFARCCQRPLVADLAAEHGNGLLPRLAALLLELAEATLALSGESDPETACACEPATALQLAGPNGPNGPNGFDAGIGIGRAEAARGMLMHRVEVADGQVTSYRILAPTEWNFHPKGVVAAGLASSGLAQLSDDAELMRRAALYVTAVDPCVAYALSVS